MESRAQSTAPETGNAPQHAPAGEYFKTVERGWDPAEVLTFIGDLEDRLRELLVVRAGPDRGVESGFLVASAEHDADEIKARASSEAERLRVRAADDARAIRIEARREAVDIVASGRQLAGEIVAGAREQEESAYARLAELRSVVRRTEQLLECVVDRSPDPTDAGGLEHPQHDHIEVSLDDDVRDSAQPSRHGARSVPPEVRRLLDQLRAPGQV